MKTIAIIAFSLLNVFPFKSSFALSPVSSEEKFWVQQPPIKQNKNRTGFFQRIKQFILYKKLHKFYGKPVTPKQKRQGRLSMILGLMSLALMFAPFGLWFALPAAIVALIFGIKSVDGNSNAEGIVGIVSGGIVVSIFLIVGIVLLSIAMNGL